MLRGAAEQSCTAKRGVVEEPNAAMVNCQMRWEKFTTHITSDDRKKAENSKMQLWVAGKENEPLKWL